VARVACSALAACATAGGQRFEPLAFSLMPELFKLLVIAIVVMADAAHSCVSTIFYHCQSSRLLRQAIDGLLHDKSARLRQRCAEYLHKVLQEWPVSVYCQHMEHVRKGVTKAISDASPGQNLGLLPCS
jgi:hypothetical protein